MAVLIALFLVTIVAHGVIGDLKCWGCWAYENRHGRHPCNDPNNFRLVKCEKEQTMCIDLVVKENKYMAKQCMFEEYWKDLKEIVEKRDNVIWKICNTTACNENKWKDY